METIELTEEQKIEGFKKKYGDVFHYTAEGKSCYLKKPSRQTISAAAVVGKNNPMKYNEILLNGCWIEGDEELKTDDGLFLGVSQILNDLIEIKEGELKKL